jgi:transposase
MKPDERAEIVKKVGEPWHRRDFETLKKRVQEFLREGFSKRQIADYFGVSTGTIKYWLDGRDRRKARKLQATRYAWSR